MGEVRKSYGQVSFKLMFSEDTPKEDVFLKAEELGIAINRLIIEHGAEIVSRGEFDKRINYFKNHPDEAYGLGIVGGESGDELKILKEWDDKGNDNES